MYLTKEELESVFGIQKELSESCLNEVLDKAFCISYLNGIK